MARAATPEQLSSTPTGELWKHGFSKRERKIVKKALRLYLATKDEDTQKWRNIRTLLACLGEDDISSLSEIEGDMEERIRLEFAEADYA